MDLTSAFSSVIALSPIALPDIIIYPYPPTLPWLPMHTSIISSEVQYCGPPYSTKGYSDHFYASPSYSDHELHNNKRFRNSYPKHGETPCQHSHSQGTAQHCMRRRTGNSSSLDRYHWCKGTFCLHYTLHSKTSKEVALSGNRQSTEKGFPLQHVGASIS